MLAVAFDNDRRHADLVQAGATLDADGGLETLVVLSLFTDARARTADDARGEQAGWWADSLDTIRGSRLWFLPWVKSNKLRAAESMATEALQWLLSDGIALSVEASAHWVTHGVMALEVFVTRRDGTRWSRLWEITARAI